MAGTLVEVELDDELEPPPRPRTPRPPRPPRPAHHRLGVVALVLALVATVGAATHGTASAARARAISGFGLATDLTVPRHEVWRAETSGLLGVIGDVVVVTGPGGYGVRGLDLADGTELWVTQDGSCTVANLDAGFGAYPAEHPSLERTRLVCADWGSDSMAVRVLEPATGATVLDTSMGSTSWYDVSGEHLVLTDQPFSGLTPSDGASLASWSLVTGEREWQVPLPSAALRGLFLGDEQVLVSSTEGLLALDLDTGEQVTESDPAFARRALPDGAWIAAQWPQDDASWVTTIVVNANGTTRWTAPGYPVPMTAADPASRAVIPVYAESGRLEVRDARTGEVVWTAAGSPWPVLALAGVLGVVEPGTPQGGREMTFIARDLSTGVELWRAENVRGDWERTLSDGERVGLVGSASSWGALSVHDLRTGAVVAGWPLPLDAPSRVVPVTGDLLAQVTATAVVVLAP